MSQEKVDLNKEKKAKMKKINGEWQKTDEQEWWISEYQIY